jgi:hypothetical protein
MHTQIVMDHNGDSRHEFDPDDVVSRAGAEERFRDLSADGFRAVALGRDGQPGTLLRNFDPSVRETLFIPQLEGG